MLYNLLANYYYKRNIVKHPELLVVAFRVRLLVTDGRSYPMLLPSGKVTTKYCKLPDLYIVLVRQSVPQTAQVPVYFVFILALLP